MAEALTRRDLSVTVLTLSREGVRDGPEYPFPVVRISRRPLGAHRMAQVVFWIARLARHHDLLFAPGLPIEAAMAARLAKKPHVLKVVGDLAWERARVRGRVADDLETFQVRRYGLWTGFHRQAQTWAARRAARVIVPSAYLRQIVERWGVAPERIEIIPNAAPAVSLSEAEDRRDRGTDAEASQGFRIVMAARLVPWKGVEQVMRGLTTLDGVELLILGDGPERPRLEALAGRLLCRARFLGEVPHAKVLDILRTADLLVLNSAYEGLPHVVLEAMAVGVPVVARAAGGTPELIRHRETGLLLKGGTEAEVAAAVGEILADRSLRERLRQAGRVLACAYNLERIADRTCRLLEEVVLTGRSAGEARDQQSSRL